jgi:hypothetical protein
MGLEHAIEERFMWCGFSKSPSAERKVFDFACDKWAQWEAEQQREQRPRPPKRHTSPDHATPITAEPMLQRRSSTSAITPRLDADSHSGNPTPARRLSRAVRVFVAWKA